MIGETSNVASISLLCAATITQSSANGNPNDKRTAATPANKKMSDLVITVPAIIVAATPTVRKRSEIRAKKLVDSQPVGFVKKVYIAVPGISAIPQISKVM